MRIRVRVPVNSLQKFNKYPLKRPLSYPIQWVIIDVICRSLRRLYPNIKTGLNFFIFLYCFCIFYLQQSINPIFIFKEDLRFRYFNNFDRRTILLVGTALETNWIWFYWF